MKIHKCEGSCEEHKGPFLKVNVTDPNTSTDWGTFSYCQEAIKEDEHRGLIVTPIKEQ